MPGPGEHPLGGDVAEVASQDRQDGGFAIVEGGKGDVAAFARHRNAAAAAGVHQPGHAEAGAGTQRGDGRARIGLAAADPADVRRRQVRNAQAPRR